MVVLIIYSHDNEKSHSKRIAVLIFKGGREACGIAEHTTWESQKGEEV